VIVFPCKSIPTTCELENLGEAGLLEVAEVSLGEAAKVEVMALDVDDQLQVADEYAVSDALAGLNGSVVFTLKSIHVGTENAVDTEY